MLQVPGTVISESLMALQNSGHQGCEGVVLWLGRRCGDGNVEVTEAYHPIHQAREDIFQIPPEGMQALRNKQRESRLFVAAQLHSHPKLAFHSLADDRWAIVRHVGALSLVLPWFALRTTPVSFLRDLKIYQMTEDNRWLEVPAKEAALTCQIF